MCIGISGHMQEANTRFRNGNREKPEGIRLLPRGVKPRNPVKVIFRKKMDGSILALFPDSCHTDDPKDCKFYTEDHGFGAIEPITAMSRTEPCTREEYKKLSESLKNRGNDLVVGQRLVVGYYLRRIAKLSNVLEEVV